MDTESSFEHVRSIQIVPQQADDHNATASASRPLYQLSPPWKAPFSLPAPLPIL